MNADQNNEPFQKIKKLSDKKFRVQPSGCVVAIEQAKAWTLNCLCVSAVKNYLVSVSAVSAFIRGEFCFGLIYFRQDSTHTGTGRNACPTRI